MYYIMNFLSFSTSNCIMWQWLLTLVLHPKDQKNKKRKKMKEDSETLRLIICCLPVLISDETFLRLFPHLQGMQLVAQRATPQWTMYDQLAGEYFFGILREHLVPGSAKILPCGEDKFLCLIKSVNFTKVILYFLLNLM